MGVVGEKNYLELHGISCLELDLIPTNKKVVAYLGLLVIQSK